VESTTQSLQLAREIALFTSWCGLNNAVTAACKRDSIIYVILSIQTRNDVNLTNLIYKHIIIFENVQGEPKGKEGEIYVSTN
jgi:hypothetical protein